MLYLKMKKRVKDEVIRFFKVEQDEQISHIQAQVLLDFFIELLHSKINNKWIADSQELLWERFQDFQVDLEMLRKN